MMSVMLDAPNTAVSAAPGTWPPIQLFGLKKLLSWGVADQKMRATVIAPHRRYAFRPGFQIEISGKMARTIGPIVRQSELVSAKSGRFGLEHNRAAGWLLISAKDPLISAKDPLNGLSIWQSSP
jgi:hypothetical protein